MKALGKTRGRAGKRFAAAFVLCCLWMAAGTVGAAEPEIVFNGIKFNRALIPGEVPLPLGADFDFHLPISADRLFLSLRLAAGFEDRLILRDDSTGAPLAKPEVFDAANQRHWFYWPNAQLDSGLLYRLLSGGQPRLEVFGLARGRLEGNSPGLATGYFPDARGLLAVSFIGGVGVDAVYKSPRRFRSGYAGELSFEYAPSALAFTSGTDFYRASANFEGYLPLWTAGERDIDAWSLYAAGYIAGDWAGGSKIPLYVLTSFGGRQTRDGIGKSVRGFQNWGYESTLKAEASFDLRLVGPGLFGVAGIRPMFYVFGDAGYFAGLYDCPSVGDKDGFLMSAGGGFALNVFNFAYFGLRAGYKFPIDDPLYYIYFPSGQQFFWGFTFLLHF